MRGAWLLVWDSFDTPLSPPDIRSPPSLAPILVPFTWCPTGGVKRLYFRIQTFRNLLRQTFPSWCIFLGPHRLEGGLQVQPTCHGQNNCIAGAQIGKDYGFCNILKILGPKVWHCTFPEPFFGCACWRRSHFYDVGAQGFKKYSPSDDKLHILACRALGFKRAAGRCGNSLSLVFLHLALGLAL